jgi:hypothetical protein
VVWLSPEDAVTARSDLAATVALSGEDWERRGARFSTIDDGEGEMVRSASGVCTTSVGDIAFRVWDYGDEPTTYLLVAGELSERPALSELLVAQMRRDGVLDDEVKVAPFADHGALAEAATHDIPSVVLDDLLASVHAKRKRAERVTYAPTLKAQRRELVATAARDLIFLPIALVVTLSLSVTAVFSKWGLSLAPRIGLVVLCVFVVVPLLASVVTLLRLSLFRDVLATTPMLGTLLRRSEDDETQPEPGRKSSRHR